MVNTSDEVKSLLDSQERLEEYCQRKQLGLPLYQLMEETRSETRKFYTFRVTLVNNINAEGTDISRRLAKSRAALNVLEVLADGDAEVPPGYESQKSHTDSLGTVPDQNGSTSEPETLLQRSVSKTSLNDKNHLLVEEQTLNNNNGKPTKAEQPETPIQCEEGEQWWLGED